VRLADTSGLQREHHDAGLLTLEYRKILLVRLLERTPVIRANRLSAEMEQVRLRGDRLSGYPGITKACRIVGQRRFLVGAIASDKAVNAYTGCSRGAGQARSTQDLATINRHLLKLPRQ
jgi:hypothetical protein